MNVRHAFSNEDPSPDERLLWGSLVDSSDALAMLRIGYEGGYKDAEKEAHHRVNSAYEDGYAHGFTVGREEGEAA